jgi:hypothetical protein
MCSIHLPHCGEEAGNEKKARESELENKNIPIGFQPKMHLGSTAAPRLLKATCAQGSDKSGSLTLWQQTRFEESPPSAKALEQVCSLPHLERSVWTTNQDLASRQIRIQPQFLEPSPVKAKSQAKPLISFIRSDFRARGTLPGRIWDLLTPSLPPATATLRPKRRVTLDPGGPSISGAICDTGHRCTSIPSTCVAALVCQAHRNAQPLVSVAYKILHSSMLCHLPHLYVKKRQK